MQLTVIIPVFNGESYLRACVDSLKLKKSNLKVIFIDDGSKDNSLKIIKELILDFPTIRVIEQQNLGLSVARNNGVKLVETDYFIFLDVDDTLDLLELFEVYSNYSYNNLDFVAYSMRQLNSDGININSGNIYKQDVDFNIVRSGEEFLIQGYKPSSACLFLYSTFFFKSNNLWFTPGISQQDVEQSVRMLLRAKRGVFIGNIVYNYYRHDGSITRPHSVDLLERYLEDSLIVAELIMKNLNDNLRKETQTAIKRIVTNIVWNVIFRFFSRPYEFKLGFKKYYLNRLIRLSFYPMSTTGMTKFQTISTFFFNRHAFLVIYFKLFSQKNK